MKIISQNPNDFYSEAAFLRGKIVFTSLRSFEGKWLFFDEHIDRLWHGGIFLFPSLALQLNKKQFRDLVISQLDLHLIGECYLRLTLCEDHLLVLKKPLSLGSSSLNLVEAMSKRSTTLKPSYLKSSDYFISDLEVQKAKDSGFDDVIFFDIEDRVCEASTSNIFVVTQKRQILTPPTSSIVLEGIVRKKLLGHLSALKWDVVEKEVSRNDLLNAHEIWLTNSIKGIRFASSFSDRQFKMDGSLFIKALESFGRFGENDE